MKALCLIFPDGYGAFFFICQRHTQSQRLFVHLLHHTQMQHPMKVKIEESWRQRLQEEFDKPYFERKQAPHTDNRPSFAPFCRIRFLRNEKAAQAAGIAYDKVVLFPASHAAYYPGARSMAMKVLYEKESLRLLGAQIVGGEGVDKRIDVLAMAIRAKMTALELTELDLSYAPPYSSAKDPVNMAGFMIEDLESGKVQQFHWNDVEDLPCDGSATLLDVRTEGEYRRGHLNGFRNIPLDDLREHLDELERDKPIYVNCQTGLRSYLACRLLTQYGFSCSHLSGGYSFYQVVTQEQQTARSAYPCGMEKL